MFGRLKDLIERKSAKIYLVGLGYVGLPIAIKFARKGFVVYGFDTQQDRIASLKKGISYIDDVRDADVKQVLNKTFFPTTELKLIGQSDVIIICVPTPLRKTKIPNISYIIAAAENIARYMRKGQLIVLESTTYPGTTRDVVLPILEEKGLKEDKDFFLAFSPERIDPGNKIYTFSKIPKVVGGISIKAGEVTKRLYSKVIDKVILVSSTETAEVVKLLENTFRIVNIGLINEFAMLCDRLKLDVWEVVEAARTKPFGFMPFYPGPGIGGHCIPKDPLYLSWKARKVGFKTRMIDSASRTNLFMPHYVVHRAERLLKEKGKDISQAKVLVLGVTYKKDVRDLRESPALEIIESLQEKRAKVSYADPYLPYLNINVIKLKSRGLTPANIKEYDLVILTTDHKMFNYKSIAKGAALILDTRNAFERAGITADHIIKL